MHNTHGTEHDIVRQTQVNEGTPNSDVESERHPMPPDGVLLASKAVWRWGALGGLFVVLVTCGLFDRATIERMLGGSAPWTQLLTYVVLAAVTAWAGGLWASLHKPLHSAMLAFQLGVLAPGAIHALIGATNVSAADIHVQLNDLLVSKAYAHSQSLGPTTFGQSLGPTTVECIIKALVKRPC